MKHLLLFLALLTTSLGFSQSKEEKDKAAILAVMNTQEEAWSNGNIESFMEGYWKSDNLKFYGQNGVTSGWDNTLANYKRNYPSKEHTGKLSFTVNAISKIDKKSYYVMGEYHLKRSVDNADGYFMIIFKKIKGQWKIIADTST